MGQHGTTIFKFCLDSSGLEVEGRIAELQASKDPEALC